MTTTQAPPITRAELARQLGVSRTYVTLLCQGKKKPSKDMADRLAEMGLAVNLQELANINAGTHDGGLSRQLEHTTFNQGVTGSRPVRPTTFRRPSPPGIFEENQGVKTLGQPTP